MTLLNVMAGVISTLSLVVAPVAASAAKPAAQKLSLANAVAKRAISKPGKQSKAIESGVIILVVVSAAVVAGVLVATGEDSPSSP